MVSLESRKKLAKLSKNRGKFLWYYLCSKFCTSTKFMVSCGCGKFVVKFLEILW